MLRQLLRTAAPLQVVARRTNISAAGILSSPRSQKLESGRLCLWSGVRFFAKKSKRAKSRRGRGLRGRGGGIRGDGAGAASSSSAAAPPLSKVMRLFVARVHPDKFGAYPKEQQVNEQSLSELTGFLSNVSNPEERFAPAQKISMEFYIYGSDDGGGGGNPLNKIDFKLRTTGGDCKRLVQRQLTELFQTAGVPKPDFTWDEKFWKTQEGLRPWDDDDEEEEQEGREESAAGSKPAKKVIKSLPELLEALDPVLQAIAAVPWLNQSDRIATFVRTKAFDDLAQQGWKNLRPAAEVQ